MNTYDDCRLFFALEPAADGREEASEGYESLCDLWHALLFSVCNIAGKERVVDR
jgi:hypothetical protein